MNDILVQHENLLRDNPFDRVSASNNAVCHSGANGKWKRYCLHIDFGIEQIVKGLFAGGVPYRHLKVLDQERTNNDCLLTIYISEISEIILNLRYK